MLRSTPLCATQQQAHLSLAKMVAMGRFVSDEIRARHTAHVVVADSDMVVVKHLQDVNKRQWDVALTWRAQPALMRVNAGLVLFHGQRLQQVSHRSRAYDARSLPQGTGRCRLTFSLRVVWCHRQGLKLINAMQKVFLQRHRQVRSHLLRPTPNPMHWFRMAVRVLAHAKHADRCSNAARRNTGSATSW